MITTDIFTSVSPSDVERTILRLGGVRNVDGSFAFGDSNVMVLEVDEQIKNARSSDDEWPFTSSQFVFAMTLISLSNTGAFATMRRVITAGLLGDALAVTHQGWVAVIDGDIGVCELERDSRRAFGPIGEAVVAAITARHA
jgi:hypothetical protein